MRQYHQIKAAQARQITPVDRLVPKNPFHIFTPALALTYMLLMIIPVFPQNVNVNPVSDSYSTVKAAFDNINNGTHTGAITIDIVGNKYNIVQPRRNFNRNR